MALDTLFIAANGQAAYRLNFYLEGKNARVIAVGEKIPGVAYRELVWLCEVPQYDLARQWLQQDIIPRRMPWASEMGPL